MAAIPKKLKSKSGISLAIALVFFLLCAMVGTVVLAAAAVSAGNTARERQLYRQTLALTSAAGVLRSELKGMTFTITCIKTETVTTTVPPADSGGKTKIETEETWSKGTGGDAPGLTVGTLFATDSFKTELETFFFQNEYQNIPGSPATLQKSITFDEVAAQNIPEVTATLTMEADYTITVALCCGKSGLTMTFPVDASQTVEMPAPPQVDTPDTNVAIKTTTTPYTNTLTWGAPLIKEGAANETTP